MSPKKHRTRCKVRKAVKTDKIQVKPVKAQKTKYAHRNARNERPRPRCCSRDSLVVALGLSRRMYCLHCAPCTCRRFSVAFLFCAPVSVGRAGGSTRRTISSWRARDRQPEREREREREREEIVNQLIGCHGRTL